jgi:hypothetical protein
VATEHVLISDSIVCFALEGTDDRLDTIEKLSGRRIPPRLQPGETHCAAGARPAEGRRKALFIDLAPWQQQ